MTGGRHERAQYDRRLVCHRKQGVGLQEVFVFDQAGRKALASREPCGLDQPTPKRQSGKHAEAVCGRHGQCGAGA
jgi:hypothetical protein